MADGGSHLPDLETQKNEISNLLKTPLKTDDIWYLVDNRWFKQWKKYVGYDTWDTSGIGEQTTHPGPIDNSPLLKGDKSGDIKDHLIDELDYVLVPQEAWDKLVSWYGITPGQDPLPRKVIEYGMFVKHCKVEVYLMELKLCLSNNLDSCIVKKFSKVDTIDLVEKEVRSLFKIPPEKETRLWNRCGSNMYDHLGDRSRTIQEAGLYQGQVVVLEVRNDDGSWPRQSRSSTSLNYNATSSARGGDSKNYNAPTSTIATRSYSSMGGNYSGNYNYDAHGTSSNTTPGLCGLNNLGNTCFMNSALQGIGEEDIRMSGIMDSPVASPQEAEHPSCSYLCRKTEGPAYRCSANSRAQEKFAREYKYTAERCPGSTKIAYSTNLLPALQDDGEAATFGNLVAHHMRKVPQSTVTRCQADVLNVISKYLNMNDGNKQIGQ